jgi:hypothetical protein
LKKHLLTTIVAIVVGVLGFAVSGIATAGNTAKPPSPPGQPDCEHGNSGQACKPDPQPDHGKDCEAHGNSGGMNEDHCLEETTTTDTTTTTETTTTIDTTTTDTTTTTETTQTTLTETTPSSSSTPPAAAPQESPEQPSAPEVESPSSPPLVGTPPKSQAMPAKAKPKAAVKGFVAPKPTRAPQAPPFTL